MNADLLNTATPATAYFCALADLETVARAVIHHNATCMQHPDMKAWLMGSRLEPSNARVGTVSTAPEVLIRRRQRAGETVSIADISLAIVTMQRAMARAVTRAKRHADRQRAAA